MTPHLHNSTIHEDKQNVIINLHKTLEGSNDLHTEKSVHCMTEKEGARRSAES